MWTGGGRRGKSRDGGAGAALLLVAIVFSVVAPLLARIIQLAASREREYLADAGAVELTRNPEAMISALQKLGAFVAVSLGVWRGLFSVLALGVAGFDLFSGVLFLWYWLTIRSAS